MNVNMKVCKCMYMYMSVLQGIQKYVYIHNRSYIAATDAFMKQDIEMTLKTIIN